MGYTTYFDGSFEFNKPVSDELRDYINKFSETRRVLRNNDRIMETFPNWRELCYKGELGTDGEYFIGGLGFCGQDDDDSVVNGNISPAKQPGLWCQWVIEDDYLVWDGGEKFYEYVEWLEYLIEHFFKPEGYVLDGSVTFEGEDSDDFGTIFVEDNVVRVEYGMHSLEEVSTDALIAELESRGYTVSN